MFFIRIRQNHPDVLKKTINAMIDKSLETALRIQFEKEQAAMESVLPNAEAPAGAKSESNGSPS